MTETVLLIILLVVILEVIKYIKNNRPVLAYRAVKSYLTAYKQNSQNCSVTIFIIHQHYNNVNTKLK